MAPAKKATTKPEVKAAETAVKTAAPKAEEKPAVNASVKAEEKAADAIAAEPVKKTESAKAEDTAKKPAVKKETVKKTPGRKPSVKKVPVKKADLKSSVCVQFSGKSYSEEDLVKIAKDVWKYDLKQKLSDLNSVELYVKPEENMVYYVMNKDYAGNFYI